MDEEFVQALRSRNVDVLTVADVGMLYKFFSLWSGIEMTIARSRL
jgi:hypothetical protein